MIAEELICRIGEELGFPPTSDQRRAMRTFAGFVFDREKKAVMILRGSAGTGKTSLASAIVRTMKKLKQRIVLLAPTGRAAKVFALNSGHEAFTIHRKIYREKKFSGINGEFNLGTNLHHHALFMVDESSMIANGNKSDSVFGSGRLLDDLIRYVYQTGNNCRLMFIGDKAQLPPVGEKESPALTTSFLEGYGLKVYEDNLDGVVRQNEGSGILYNATRIRKLIDNGVSVALPKIRFAGFKDIVCLRGDELIEQLNMSYAEVGIDETIVITRSNKRANIFNRGIRNAVLGREEELTGGDILMIVKNKYFDEETDSTRKSPDFIANGDRAIVRRVRNQRSLYGFSFADVSLVFPDYDDKELETTVILDSLLTESPALTRGQNEQLFEEVMKDYADVSLKSERMKKLKADIYYNAVQIKYGYAVTCHKAQGGQWEHVYFDQGYMSDSMLNEEYLHWLYTAFTRAAGKLFLVNWPKRQTEGRVEE